MFPALKTMYIIFVTCISHLIVYDESFLDTEKKCAQFAKFRGAYPLTHLYPLSPPALDPLSTDPVLK